MIDKTPECCKECPRAGADGNCNRYADCTPWRTWFRKEWAQIRRAADRIKKNNDREASKK